MDQDLYRDGGLAVVEDRDRKVWFSVNDEYYFSYADLMYLTVWVLSQGHIGGWVGRLLGHFLGRKWRTTLPRRA